MKSRHRKDSNHDLVVAALALRGYWFWDASQSNLGVDGFAVGHGRIVPIEIKDPKAWRGLQLSPHEAKVHQRLKAGGVVVEILTGDDGSLGPFSPRARDFYDVARNR